MTESKNTNGPLSSCCKAECINHSSDEGTGYMTCKTCEKPCNPVYRSETNGLLSDAEVDAIKVRFTNATDPDLNILSGTEEVATLVLVDIPALLADRAARIERNREAIEKLFAKMNELDTPKRGELHLLMISILS